MDEYSVVVNAHGRYPNGREAYITFKYRYYYSSSTYGAVTELRVNINVSITDDKKNRMLESKNFLHKDYCAQSPGSAPSWLNNMYLTLLEIVKSRKNQLSYIQQLDKKGMVILTAVLKGLP